MSMLTRYDRPSLTQKKLSYLESVKKHNEQYSINAEQIASFLQDAVNRVKTEEDPLEIAQYRDEYDVEEYLL